MNRTPVTVIVLTLNEQDSLSKCLTSIIEVTDDIHVLDSFSSDNTVAIAQGFEVAVHQNRFTGFGNQRNWAIDNIPHKYSWVLHLDADEIATKGFVACLDQVVRSNPEDAGFYVPNKLMLGEHWLKYSSGYPIYQVRLFHRDRLRFTNHGHGQREITNGRIGFFDEPYLHYAYAKGLEHWMAKHTHYARAEVDQYLRVRCSLKSLIRSLFVEGNIGRRRAMKQLSFMLPYRPWLRFLHVLLIKRGFMDGNAGWQYARMQSLYEKMFDVYKHGYEQGLK